MSLKRKRIDSNDEDDECVDVEEIHDADYTRYLFGLVTKGRVNELKGEKNINFSSRDALGDTFLHRAVRHCKNTKTQNLKAMITYLLSQAPKLMFATNKKGQTALSYLCTTYKGSDFMEIFTIFIEFCTTEALNMPDSKGRTPLHHLLSYETNISQNGYCCENCHGPYKEFDPFFDEETENYYWMSARGRDAHKHIPLISKVAKILIVKGANINAKDSNNRDVLSTCLAMECTYQFMYMWHSEDSKLSSWLLENGAIITAMTVKFAPDKIVGNQLIDKMDLNKIDENGWTPLHHIMVSNSGNHYINYPANYETYAQYMLEKGAVLEDSTDIIQLASDSQYKFEFIKYLLEKSPGYNVNIRNSSGSTLLIEYGTCSENIEFLLNLGADVKIVNNKGKNVLFSALLCKNVEIIKKLVELGADPLAIVSNDESVIQNLCLEMAMCDMQDTFYYSWLPCLKYLLSLPQINSSPMHKSLTLICTYLLKSFISTFYIADKKDRIIKLLTYIVNSNSNITTILIDTPLRTIGSYTFENSKIDYVSRLLITFKFDNEIIDFMHNLLDLGFPVSNVCNDSITPLTALLGFNNNIFTKVHLIIAKDFIERGVNVGSTALQFKEIEDYTEEQVKKKQEIKDSYCIPDAILVAYLKEKVLTVKFLLDYCWFPPIFLVYFDYNLSLEKILEFKCTYEKLSQINIPHGCPLFNILKEIVPEFGTETDGNSADSPASLQELAKYATRFHLAKQASLCGSNLPAMIQNTVPERLHFLILH